MDQEQAEITHMGSEHVILAFGGPNVRARFGLDASLANLVKQAAYASRVRVAKRARVEAKAMLDAINEVASLLGECVAELYEFCIKAGSSVLENVASVGRVVFEELRGAQIKIGELEKKIAELELEKKGISVHLRNAERAARAAGFDGKFHLQAQKDFLKGMECQVCLKTGGKGTMVQTSCCIFGFWCMPCLFKWKRQQFASQNFASAHRCMLCSADDQQDSDGETTEDNMAELIEAADALNAAGLEYGWQHNQPVPLLLPVPVQQH